MKNRKTLGLSFALTVGVLMFAATAYACTTVSGNTTVSPTSATHGSSVSMSCSASNINTTLIPSGTSMKCYYLDPATLHDSMNTCMGLLPVERTVAGPGTVSGSGTSGSISTVTNSNFNVQGLSGDTAWVCFISVNASGSANYNYGTNPASVSLT